MRDVNKFMVWYETLVQLAQRSCVASQPEASAKYGHCVLDGRQNREMREPSWIESGLVYEIMG